MRIKKDQAVVVRSTLKRNSSEAKIMRAELHAEKIRKVSLRHVAYVKMPDNRTGTTNLAICEAFIAGGVHQGSRSNHYSVRRFGGRLFPLLGG